MEIYYLENGKYQLHYSDILEDNREDIHYNADTQITLKAFPDIKMNLADIFEGIE